MSGLTVLGGVPASVGSATSTTLAKLLDLRMRQQVWYRVQPPVFDHYVDSVNGSDSNDGASPLTPWQTLAKVHSTVSVAGTISAPVRIGLYGGSVFRETFTVPVDWMVFSSYGPWMFTPPKLKGSKDFSAATWTLVSGQTWQATITAPGLPNGACFWNENTVLFSVATAGAVTVGTYNITGTTFTIWLPDGSNPNGQQIEVTDLTTCVTDQKVGTVMQGVKICHSGSFGVLKQPTVLSFGGALRFCEIGPHGGQGVNWSQTNGGLIEFNNVHDCWNGVAYPSGAGDSLHLQAFVDLEVRYNRVSTGYQGIFASNSGVAWRGLNIHHNRVRLSQVNDINVNGGTAGFPSAIFHNTVHHRPLSASAAGHGIVNQLAVAGSVWRNNIVVSDYNGASTNVQLFAIAPANTVGQDNDYNLGWVYPGSTCNYGRDNTSNYSTFAQWKAAMATDGTPGGKEAHSINADPLLTNLLNEDWTLQSASPAINAGQILGYPSEVYAGTSPDIGAYEIS